MSQYGLIKIIPYFLQEKCEELEKPIAKKIKTCKTLVENQQAQKLKLKEERDAVEAAQTAANEAETAADKSNEQMKLAETAKIDAENAKTNATTSKDTAEIQTANTTAHAAAQKAQNAAKEAKKEKVNAENAKNVATTAAAKAGSQRAVADKYVEAATNSTQKAASNALEAEEHAKTAKAAADAAKTAADKAVKEGINLTETEVKDPSTPDTLLSITTTKSIISTPLKPVKESKEVISESNPEIPVVNTTSKPASINNKGIGSQNDPKEINSGNAVTMSTIGFISCLIFYSLINQLEVPASLF